MKWSTSDRKVATVSQKGLVKGVKAGKATITAKVSGKKLTCKVTVKVGLNATKKTLTTGSKYQLKVYGAAKTIKWKSSDDKVATVTSNGKVTAKTAGTATITATTGGKKYTCNVTVPGLNLTKKSVDAGETFTLTAKNVGNSVKWRTSDSAVASIKKVSAVEYKVTGKKPGTATITATVGKTKYTCKVTVTAKQTTKPETPDGGRVLHLNVTATAGEGANESLKLWFMNTQTAGALGEADHQEKILTGVSTSGTNATIELPLEYFMNSATGKLDGFTFGVFSEGPYTIQFNSIELVDGETIAIDLSESNINYSKGYDTGLTGCNTTGEIAYGENEFTITDLEQYSVHKVIFSEKEASDATSDMKVRFSVRGDASSEEMNNLELRIFNSDAAGSLGELTDYKVFQLQSQGQNTNGKTEDFEIDLKWLLNSEGKFAGFTFGTYGYNAWNTGEKYDVYITKIAIIKGEEEVEVLDLTGTTFGYKDASGITGGTNSGGGATMSGSNIYSWSNYQGTVCKVNFATAKTFN